MLKNIILIGNKSDETIPLENKEALQLILNGYNDYKYIECSANKMFIDQISK